MPTDTWDFGVVNKLQRICGSGIFSEGRIKVVDLPCGLIHHHILQDSSEPNRIEDLRLLLFAEINAFGIAPSLHVKDSLISPLVFVVSDQFAVANCTEGSLACS